MLVHFDQGVGPNNLTYKSDIRTDKIFQKWCTYQTVALQIGLHLKFLNKNPAQLHIHTVFKKTPTYISCMIQCLTHESVIAYV